VLRWGKIILLDIESLQSRKIGSQILIQVDYEPPPKELSPYISVYYLFTTDEPCFEDIERADIAQFRFVLEGDADIVFGDGHADTVHPAYVMGPRNKASRVTVRGPGRVFGVGLLPAGWAAFTKLPADKHVNRLIDATTVFGDALLEVHARLQKLTNVQEMAAVMNAKSTPFYKCAEAEPHWFIRAVDMWLEAKLSPDIKDLETATGLSRRQIERMARQYYGSPPKVLVRKYRALRTANAIARGDGAWQDFIDEGFYDQSHCIRELKEFVGITPSAIRGHASRLTNLTFDRSQLMGRIPSLSALT
jgi:AraC-like DNA-binding protein